MTNSKISQKRAEQLLDRYIAIWVRLFHLGAWRITYQIVEAPPIFEGDECVAINDVKYTKKTATLRFSRLDLISDASIEVAVIHEFMHHFDRGLRAMEGRDAHELIARLAPVLRRMRIRLTRRP